MGRFRHGGVNKYANERVVVDGRSFHSKKEGQRYLLLKARQDAGQIFNLECQVLFQLEVPNPDTGEVVWVTSLRVDFTYVTPDGVFVVEDVKGYRTDEWKIKARLFRACHGVSITEV